MGFLNSERRTAEREKMARLEEADDRLDSLVNRAVSVKSSLLARNERNHWSESVHRMITEGNT